MKNRQRKTKEQQSLEECRQKVSPDKFMYVTVHTSTYTMGNHVEINYDFSVCLCIAIFKMVSGRQRTACRWRRLGNDKKTWPTQWWR